VNDQERKTILLIEDEAILAIVQAKTLRQLGYTVITAQCGEEAIALARGERTIDLILMDIELGKGIDGAEAARQILAQRTIPIVFNTSHAERELVEKLRGITRYGCVIKNSGNFVLQSSLEMAFELFDADKKLKNELAERKRAEEALKMSTHSLGERVKELHCLYSISELVQKEDISHEKLWQESANLLAHAYMFPEIAACCITWGEREYSTGNFKKTIWSQNREIMIHHEWAGNIEVCYLRSDRKNLRDLFWLKSANSSMPLPICWGNPRSARRQRRRCV
jgi:CheY-like chemotaxis protein